MEQARDGEPKWIVAYRQLAIAYGRAGQLADADITLADEALMTGDNNRPSKWPNDLCRTGPFVTRYKIVPMIFYTDMAREKSDNLQS